MIIDTHAHYDDSAFDDDREEILETLNQHGIEIIVNIGANIKSSRNTINMTEKYPQVFGVIGVHPSETDDLTENDINWLREQTRRKKILAIGEIGLDYYWDKPDREIQKYWFKRQLQLAKEVNLPVVIHSRDAAKDTLDIMKEEQAENIGGVIHCFSYSIEMAKEYINMGFYLGIGGVITFQNAKKLKEVVEYIPVEKIVLETDCPYLAPVPNRGKRNTSFNLAYVIDEISKIKGIDKEHVIMITNKNAKELYRLKGNY